MPSGFSSVTSSRFQSRLPLSSKYAPAWRWRKRCRRGEILPREPNSGLALAESKELPVTGRLGRVGRMSASCLGPASSAGIPSATISNRSRAGTATGTSRESNFPTYRNRRLAAAKKMMAILDRSHNKSDSVSAGITGGCATRMQTKKIGRYSLARKPRCAMGRRSHSQVCPRGHIAKCSHPVCQNFPRR